MKTTSKPLRGKILLDVRAPESDALYGRWHKSWRRPESNVTAFYFPGDGVLKPTWYASWGVGDKPCLRACASKEEALDYRVESDIMLAALVVRFREPGLSAAEVYRKAGENEGLSDTDRAAFRELAKIS